MDSAAIKHAPSGAAEGPFVCCAGKLEQNSMRECDSELLHEHHMIGPCAWCFSPLGIRQQPVVRENSMREHKYSMRDHVHVGTPGATRNEGATRILATTTLLQPGATDTPVTTPSSTHELHGATTATPGATQNVRGTSSLNTTLLQPEPATRNIRGARGTLPRASRNIGVTIGDTRSFRLLSAARTRPDG